MFHEVSNGCHTVPVHGLDGRQAEPSRVGRADESVCPTFTHRRFRLRTDSFRDSKRLGAFLGARGSRYADVSAPKADIGDRFMDGSRSFVVHN
jgi:hypothetical protein